MSSVGDTENPDERVAKNDRQPYVLRSLLADIHLDDPDKSGSYITCVEFWSGNLYIGTSASEVLHYVLIPGVDADGDDNGSFIEASRRSLPLAESASLGTQDAGVQRILTLPAANKACILCNGSTTFFSLPELTPILASTKFSNCYWIGGLDENEREEETFTETGTTIMICQKSRTRLVSIEERIRIVRVVELGACVAGVRRSNIACVADATSYSLLDVVEQGIIPLLEISSTQNTDQHSQEHLTTPHVSSQSTSPNPPSSENHDRPNLEQGTTKVQGEGESLVAPHLTAHDTLAPGSQTSSRRVPSRSPERESRSRESVGQPASSAVSEASAEREDRNQRPEPSRKLRPHIVSPTPGEFLLTTGTTPDEAGVGLFFDLEGDLAPRGTLEFTRYPESLCVDGGSALDPSQSDNANSEEGFVLAVMDAYSGYTWRKVIEIKRWDLSPDDPRNETYMLDIPLGQAQSNQPSKHSPEIKAGMAKAASAFTFNASEVTRILERSRIALFDSQSNQVEQNLARERAELKLAEADFLKHLNSFQANIMLWAGNQIWWINRNSLIVRMEAALESAVIYGRSDKIMSIDRRSVEKTLAELRGLKPKADFEFISLKYIRQKGSLLLFMDLMVQAFNGTLPDERDIRKTEEALLEGDIDPRILISLIPMLQKEVFEGRNGIWANGGIKSNVEIFLRSSEVEVPEILQRLGSELLLLVKRYLFVWRQKKGFESIEDKQEVFLTVDAALIHLLLILDATSPRGPARKGSMRADLNAVVDNGVDCFEHAVELLEQYKRLYVLSRLYQSRKMAAHVLGTWRRMIEGEQDEGGEFSNGESEIRKYIAKINDAALVEQYGIWLANRNPRIGVRVFADGNSKIKFEPGKVVELLKEKAPGAVRHFLEHLVFEDNLAAYANDLISYYVDIVTTELQDNAETRSDLLQSYESYRALRVPKPTYLQFATSNPATTDWWHDRLRLLQLLGGSHGTASQYDVSGILARIEVYEHELVPEMIILYGRQSRHHEAIRLLTHNLGDFDTAVSYCILGGLRTYSTTSRSAAKEGTPSKPEQIQLFESLLEEFLKIENIDDRTTQTSEVLTRFVGWFDIAHVLSMIPDDWSVDLVSSFLENALRHLVTESRESSISRALTSGDNVAANAALLENPEWLRPRIEEAS